MSDSDSSDYDYISDEIDLMLECEVDECENDMSHHTPCCHSLVCKIHSMLYWVCLNPLCENNNQIMCIICLDHAVRLCNKCK